MIPRMYQFRPRTLRYLETPPDEVQAPATTEPVAEIPAEGQPPADKADDGETETTSEADTETPDEAAKVAELPDWAQSEMRRLRSESAARRVRERELTEQLSAAKTPEEFEAVVIENAKLQRAATLGDLTRTHSLSADALDLLADVPDDKLAVTAQKLASLSQAPAAPERTPSGGLTPGDDEGAFDPVALAMAARAARR